MSIKKLINISDLTKDDVDEIFDNIDNLRNSEDNCLYKKSIGMIFEKYSTRTRISFQVGIAHLKGNAIDLNFENLKLPTFSSIPKYFKEPKLF